MGELERAYAIGAVLIVGIVAAVVARARYRQAKIDAWHEGFDAAHRLEAILPAARAEA